MSHITSRWSTFRSSDDSIPTTPFEAGVFLQNARLHLLAYGISAVDARLLLVHVHGLVNKGYFKEVA